MVESLVDSVQALASDSPLLLGAIAVIVAFAAVSIVKFVVGLAVRVALIGAVVVGGLVAVGYLG
ncbi:hypothetical protein [Halovivax sp.]|uniref:hypothetical protein n=1 Tax=Halovivax sp. TaxID=1935978 RepID=UPI0025C0FE25|nr:hypothetical protein [Halovivax sp.]